MTETEFKALIRDNGWTTVRLTGDDPLDHLARCEWACEVDAELDAETLAIAEFHRRLVGGEAGRFPLVMDALAGWEEGFKASIESFSDVCLTASRPLDLIVASEFALESGTPLDDDTFGRAQEAFSQIRYRAQAFPKLAAAFGVRDCDTFDPFGIRWHSDGATTLMMPSEIQSLLPANVVVTVQKCALHINYLSEQGFYKVQERWENGVLQEQYGTKVPLGRWMNRGIAHCIAVSLQNPVKGLATLIGVFDIAERVMVSIDEGLFATKAFEHVAGKSSNSLEIQFAKNVFSALKQSPRERETISQIMAFCDGTVFSREHEKFHR
jgi:hypothetical protein